jgi:CRISPR-associated protein Cmr1
MQSITFECEVITPMFLAGADGSTPELRPPSIKGALRFWWRALNGHLPLGELKKLEGDIFGDTSQQSKFKMSFVDKDFQTSREKPLPHQDYSTFKKEAINIKQRFEITFICRNEAIKNLIENLFPLCCVLGGFGGRARRGFGSVKITNGNYPTSLQDIYICLDNLVPNRFIRLEDKIIYKALQKPDYPYIEEIEIGRANANLLRSIGQATHDVNKKNGYDYGKAAGSANPRFSSPVYISAIATNRGLQSIITTLHHPNGNNRSYDIQKQLKKEIV